MDRDEAKFILSVYRPGHQDAEDPQFTEALELVEQDAELACWFEQEQALDRAIADKLKAAPVPTDLRQSILAGKKVVRIPLWRQKGTIVTLAATITMILTISGLWYRANSGVNGYRRDMTSMLSNIDRLEAKTDKLDEARQWLARKGSAPADINLMPTMGCLNTLGCRVLEWKGSEVTLICFKDTADELQETVHLLVINRKDLPCGMPTNEVPAYVDMKSFTTATWADDKYIYLMAGHGKRAQLAKFFPSASR